MEREVVLFLYLYSYYWKHLNRLYLNPWSYSTISFFFEFWHCQWSFQDRKSHTYSTCIHKKGWPLVVSNYGKISLLSVFSKIMDKLMYNRRISYLDKQSIILENQLLGFRSKRSTSYVLLFLTDKIQRAVDTGTFSCGIFLGPETSA